MTKSRPARDKASDKVSRTCGRNGGRMANSTGRASDRGRGKEAGRRSSTVSAQPPLAFPAASGHIQQGAVAPKSAVGPTSKFPGPSGAIHV